MSVVRAEKYRLYVAPFNQETAKVALSEPYAKASKSHILLYKKGKKPDEYKEITDENINLLPAADRKWLQEINVKLIREFMLKHREEEERANKKFLEEFERELEAERKKLSEQGSGETCKG